MNVILALVRQKRYKRRTEYAQQKFKTNQSFTDPSPTHQKFPRNKSYKNHLQVPLLIHRLQNTV